VSGAALLDLVERFHKHAAALKAMGPETDYAEADFDREYEGWWETFDKIAESPARTYPELVAKLSVLRPALEGNGDEANAHWRIVESLAADANARNRRGDVSDFFGLEGILSEMGAFIGMIHHLANSPSNVEPDEWIHLGGRLETLHRQLDDAWRAAFHQRRIERQEHDKAVAAAKAEAEAAAAPLSGAELQRVEALRRLMLSAAEVVVDKLRTVDAEAPAAAGCP
jgi:hypothetical protein